jgi:hypothetical protein
LVYFSICVNLYIIHFHPLIHQLRYLAVSNSSQVSEWNVNSMTTHGTINGLNGVFGVWHFNSYLRVTFVANGWLVVWDHRDNPPTRYDCKAANHQATCELASSKLRELTTA